MKKLAVISTHPIQYYAPYFRLLAQRDNIDLKVFYTWGEEVLKEKYDPGFKKNIEWDIPLLEGYNYEFVENVASEKGSHHFWGINNPGLINKIENWKPDAIYIIGWSYLSHLKALVHFKNKIKIIFRGDSTLLDESKGFSIKKAARYLALKWVYKHIDIALYVGENNRKYYKKFGLKDSQLVYAPHAIDNNRFLENEEKNETEAKNWRKTIGIGDEDIVFLFAGKLEPKKDPALLLQAFININQQNCHLIFTGNGILEDELKNMSQGYKNVHFIGFQNQSQMPVVYRLGNVLVLPSKGPGETWGLAINEAMACGRPAIASDKCGGAIDLVFTDVNGYIFQSGNLQQLEKVMLACVKKKSELRQMGKAGLNIVRLFSFNVIVDSIEAILIEPN